MKTKYKFLVILPVYKSIYLRVSFSLFLSLSLSIYLSIYIYINLSTEWANITLLNFVKLSTLLIKKGNHKRYTTLTALAVVWALWSFKIFFWSELHWWALKEQNSCCLQIDPILRSLTLLSWALCWSRRVATSNMQRSQL